MSLTGAAFFSQVFLKTSGAPYASCLVYHYEPGGTTARTVWTDEAATSADANPSVGDASGRVTFYGKGNYRILVKASVADGNATLYDWDPLKLEDQANGLRGELQATSYPSATAANRGAIFNKTNVGGDTTELGVNLDGSGFTAIQLQNTALTSTQLWAKGADLASASTLTLGSDGNTFDVTGTVTITAISSKTAGTIIVLHFDSTLTLTYNATSMQLPGLANIQTAAGDKSIWQSEGSGNWRCIAYTKASGKAIVPLRSYLTGLTLSTAGSSTTISIAAGEATDGATTASMVLAAFTKTTASFAAGTGNGALDTGTTLGSADTWYHLWLISTAGGVLTDVLMSLSATAPTMPAGYTLKRRIGSGKLDGSKNWTAFTQDGDYFRWAVSILDVNTTNPGTSAVTSTLTVPTGVNVYALINAEFNGVTSVEGGIYVSDLAATDQAASITAAPLSSTGFSPTGSTATPGGYMPIRTNTSAQVRYRAVVSAGSDVVRIATLGWIDRRGRDA